jgi:hypothetical protein
MITTDRFQGRDLWIGRSLVRFDAQGEAVGIIHRVGEEPLSEPAPLTEAEVEAVRGVQHFGVEGPAERPKPTARRAGRKTATGTDTDDAEEPTSEEE